MLSERQDLRITFTKDVFQDILHTLDTEWDRLCAKILYAGNLTEKEMVSVGIDPDTVRNGTERIKYVSDEVKNAFLAANDILNPKIRSKLNKIKENNEQVLLKLEGSKEHLSEKRKMELEISSRVNEERIADLEMLLISNDGASARRKQKAVRRIALSLVQCVRLKRRRAGAGAKRKMSEEEEIFLSECIEERASIHGRHSEGVLFYGKRLKQKDLLSIVNYKRLKMGKDVLKSAKTVLNRGRPRNKRSLQAKCHNVGKWLFCSRAPPKTRMDDRIHTRHQWQAHKLLKMDAWSTSQKMVQHLYLYISKDDKAYLRPGTSGIVYFSYCFI